jgi:cyclophilin family peptidyl-prolyl cis-trans isomerase
LGRLLTLIACGLVAPLSCGAETSGKAGDEASEMTSKEASATATADPIKAIDAFIAEQDIDKSRSGWKTHLPRPPKQSFDPAKSYFWFLETNQGDVKVKLLPETAPMHVTSTIYLTRLGFYDGLSFHRVITGFMAQGGCPLGTGTGGPGYKYAGEFDPSVKHDAPGKLSMANSGPGTDGSQFFLTFVPTPHLDGKHTIFGEVVEGMGTVQKLESLGSRGGRPQAKLEIVHATVSVE